MMLRREENQPHRRARETTVAQFAIEFYHGTLGLINYVQLTFKRNLSARVLPFRKNVPPH